MLLITYPYYSIKAFYFSCQNLEQLEQSKDMINQGNVSISAIGFWFLAVEAFINTLLKIACFLENKDFKEFRGKDIGSRLSSVFDLLKKQASRISIAQEYYQGWKNLKFARLLVYPS